MHSSRELELREDAVKVTWCACEHCNAAGPKSMTLIRNHHEYTVDLDLHCCTPNDEEECVSGENFLFDGHNRPRGHIRR
jgi:hypothetical protein